MALEAAVRCVDAGHRHGQAVIDDESPTRIDYPEAFYWWLKIASQIIVRKPLRDKYLHIKGKSALRVDHVTGRYRHRQRALNLHAFASLLCC